MRKKNRKRSQLTALHDNLAKVLGEDTFKKLADIARLRRSWPNIVGPMLSQHTEPLRIESAFLHTAVDHPSMAQQVRFLQQEICKACFHQCHIAGIRGIRTRMVPGAGIPTPTLMARSARFIGLSDKKRVAGSLQHIQDKALRHAMFDARLAQLAYEVERDKE